METSEAPRVILLDFSLGIFIYLLYTLFIFALSLEAPEFDVDLIRSRSFLWFSFLLSA